MATAAKMGGSPVGRPAGRVVVAPRRWSGGLADCLGQGHQVITAGRWWIELALVTDELPPARRGQPAGVALAQVV